MIVPAVNEVRVCWQAEFGGNMNEERVRDGLKGKGEGEKERKSERERKRERERAERR